MSQDKKTSSFEIPCSIFDIDVQEFQSCCVVVETQNLASLLLWAKATV